jgi:hypothetical protein
MSIEIGPFDYLHKNLPPAAPRLSAAHVSVGWFPGLSIARVRKGEQSA